MIRPFVILISTVVSVFASPALDLLERQRDVEHIDPNYHSDRPPPPTPEDVEEEKVRIVRLSRSWSGSPADALWQRATVFQSPTNAFVQSIAFTALFHAQGAWGTAESSRERENFRDAGVRRLRLGARLKTFFKTDIEAVVDLDDDERTDDLTTLRLDYQATGRDTVSVGKFRSSFGHESGPAQNLETIERSLLGNMLLPRRTLGLSYRHEFDTWSASIGYFSGEQANGLPRSRGNNFVSLSLEGALPDEKGISQTNNWHVDYIYNTTPNDSDVAPGARYPNGATSFSTGQPIQNPLFRHMLAVGMEYEEGMFAFKSEMMAGFGSSQVWGITFQPTYWVIPGTLQAVGRFHYARSDSSGGLVQGFGLDADPIITSLPLATGDEFFSLYAGANLHIYQDRFKIQSGIEYSRLTESSDDSETESLLFQTAAKLAF